MGTNLGRSSEDQNKNLAALQFGTGEITTQMTKAVDELLETPRVLQKQAGIRMQHFHDRQTGRLVGTIATRLRPDGTIDVAASVVNLNQGRGNEQPATRKTGCRLALLRLIKGNKNGIKIYAADALYLLERGPQTELGGEILDPADIRVVNFTQKEISEVIANRSVLNYFPGAKHIPKLRKAKPFVPGQTKRSRTQTGRTAVALQPQQGFFSRFFKLFT